MVIVAEAVDVRRDFRAFESSGREAVAEMVAAVRRDPNEVRRYLQELRQRADAGDASTELIRACGVASWLLAEHPAADRFLSQVDADGMALYYHGKVLMALERFEEAAERFRLAGEHGWDPVECTFLRAGATRRAGRLDESEQIVRSTGTAGATRAEYSYQMGCIMADRSDSFGAIEYFERAADMDPRHSGALFRLAELYSRQGDESTAIQLYERALSTPPYHLGALINLGLLYEETENYSAAAFCFRRVLEFHPNHARAQLYLKDVSAVSDETQAEEDAVRELVLDRTLQRSITDFELSARSRNCLERAGISTLGDLARTPESVLLRTKNFGETSLSEVHRMMESAGLRIGQLCMEPSSAAVVVDLAELLPEQRKLFEIPVSDLQLSVRARKCLNRLGISAVGELISKSADELLSVRNFGVTSLNEIRAKLETLGVSLRNE